MKYIYTLKDGQRTTFSAKTRSWEKAEAQATEIRDSWDPVKQKLRELERQQQALALEEVLIEQAIERWLLSLRADLENDYTYRKYGTAARKVVAWSEDRGLQRLSEITADVLDQWKAQWKPTAKRPDDRMGRNTAGRHLAKVKAFLRYCQRMGWTQMNAAIQIRAIKAEDSETLPLLGGRYEQVLQATYDYDKAMRPDDRYGPDMRALFELMRWSGLRISDALARERASITANRLTLRTVKSQGKRKLTFVLPDHVIAAALVQTAGPASRVGCSGG